MSRENAWLSKPLANKAIEEKQVFGSTASLSWLGSKNVAELWEHYTRDTNVPDTTPPPAPTDIKVDGNVITWKAEADLQSGLSHFIILRDGTELTTVRGPKNAHGHSIFQGLHYSDTPLFPLKHMRYEDNAQIANIKHTYTVIAVNTQGLKSEK